MQDLLRDLRDQLRGTTRLRLLRVPGVTDEGHTQLVKESEDMLPNCLLVDTLIGDGVVPF